MIILLQDKEQLIKKQGQPGAGEKVINFINTISYLRKQNGFWLVGAGKRDQRFLPPPHVKLFLTFFYVIPLPITQCIARNSNAISSIVPIFFGIYYPELLIIPNY